MLRTYNTRLMMKSNDHERSGRRFDLEECHVEPLGEVEESVTDDSPVDQASSDHWSGHAWNSGDDELDEDVVVPEDALSSVEVRPTSDWYEDYGNRLLGLGFFIGAGLFGAFFWPRPKE